MMNMQRSWTSPGVVTLNSALGAFSSGQQWLVALRLMKVMLSRGMVPDVVTCTALLSSCEKGHQWEMAVDALGSMSRWSLSPNVFTYNAAMSSLEKGQQWRGGHLWTHALALLQQMLDQSITPNITSFCTAIGACGWGLQWVRALALFEHMRRLRLTPDIVVYNVTLAACERSERWALALSLLGRMRRDRCQPDGLSYDAAANACERAGRASHEVAVVRDLFRHAVRQSAAGRPSSNPGLPKVPAVLGGTAWSSFLERQALSFWAGGLEHLRGGSGVLDAADGSLGTSLGGPSCADSARSMLEGLSVANGLPACRSFPRLFEWPRAARPRSR